MRNNYTLVLTIIKLQCLLASSKGVTREVRSEVKGTAEVGTEEHEPDKRL